MLMEKSVIEIINAHLDSGKVQLPVFHPIALRIQKEISKAKPDVRLIEQLIIKDQSLTGSVLKVANSSFYKGLNEVATIRNAIVRLGVDEVSNIVMLVTHANNFRSNDPFVHDIMRKLWKHSVGCAIGAQWLAGMLDFQEISHETFVAGLLHDVGKLFLLKVVDEIKHSGKINIRPSDALLNDVLDSLHARYGFLLMRQWNLPQKYCKVAREHHAEEFDLKNFLLVMVRLADKACNKMGIGLNLDPGMVLMATPEANSLHLSEIDLARLELKLEDYKVFAHQK